ncbi:beta-L-arabinofuranosidase domain-containing protein [Arcicella sp. DC2W]|uniref:Beta-L-arabinofuranosidase domain-containing protein n=1 Tax=Arcicella gelida TaxID=2984195 RepID=A0ABU5S5U1_9BACT|nr:beta-L-arabinofuranosidase domain-containing protein [Arcicella sp. DC2W]MEA5403779.1 beta-L-arabinofuranosidase domain-containing protein [Arcicella sp. DC2W]
MSILSFTKNIALIAISLCWANSVNAQKNDYPIQPVTFTQVHFKDNFWLPKMKINAEVTIPYTLNQCKITGRIDNFAKAAGKMPVEKSTTYTFDDTDLYKVIEGASYSLQTKKDASLEKYLDTLISNIGAAQEPDGYLYTFRTMKIAKPHEWVGSKRWEKEEDLSHELYNAGHLYEAAVAHFQATGKKNLLNIAIKNADLLVKTFGWGKEERFPGHQIVETGLTRLYRVTGKKEYLMLAKFFLDLRGKEGHLNQEYSQSHKKVVDQHTAVGHAVRATYMYTSMADVAALTGDKQYLSAIDDIWNDVVDKKIYITGGIGATGNGEAFGADYDLPNMSAYAETCAAIANVYWNNRMFLLHGDAKYIDVLERTLYNGLLSGISLTGDKFFYPNPLASMGQHQRRTWYDCACCISNMTRFLPSVPGYAYAQNQNDLYINLFVGGDADIQLTNTKVAIHQETNYPWSGKDEFTINPAKKANFNIHIRIPGWAINQPIKGDLYQDKSKASDFTLLLNGKPAKYTIEKGYAVINRTWVKGDKLSLDLPMDVKKIEAKDSVKADLKRFALQRGPLVYCLEGMDNADSSVLNLVVDKNATVIPNFQANLLNGIMTLEMEGSSTKRQVNSNELIQTQQKVTAIPYFTWANRGSSEMEVWIPFEASASKPKPAPTIASKSKVSASIKSPMMLKALNDQYDAENSIDRSGNFFHWWPKKNSTEFIQYDFDQTYTVSSSDVYWFDDSPWGGCYLPTSWRILYQKDGEWIPVKVISQDAITKDKFNTIQFEPVSTKALKLEVQLSKDNAAGIHEWKVK